VAAAAVEEVAAGVEAVAGAAAEAAVGANWGHKKKTNFRKTLLFLLYFLFFSGFFLIFLHYISLFVY
jgi:hypothetical protein